MLGCQEYIDERSRPFAIKQEIVIDDQNIRKHHVATRPHNRKVIYHPSSGYWYVFYGHGDKDPDGKYRISWRSSKDGVNWSERHTAYEGNCYSSSTDVILSGDTITMLIFRPQYHREKAGVPKKCKGKDWNWKNCPNQDFPLPYEIRQYEINNGDLKAGPIFVAMDGSVFNGAPHYGSLTQDTKGFFWVGARALTDKRQGLFQAWVVRSSKANDISKWEPHTALLEASGKGTVAVQVIALDNAKVFAVIFSQSDVKIFGSLYDTQTGKWGKPYVITEGNAESKRAVASFDPGTKRLHLVNIDNSGALRHKILSSPYREQDWFPKAGNKTPGIIIDSNVLTKSRADNNISLSIDTSKSPAPLVVAYHKKTPNYRIRWYNGVKWGKKDFPIGIQGSNRCADEISFIRDFSERLGLIYCVLPVEKGGKGKLDFVEILKEKYLGK